jgi:hypothetical protein
MSSASPISRIRHAIETMDLEVFDELLDYWQEYNGMGKFQFIDFMDEVFTAMRALGDTQLLSYAGTCGSTLCDNCNKTGYTFVGNQSKAFFDLLICEDPLLSIELCKQFEMHEPALELGKRLEIAKPKGFIPPEPTFDQALNIEICKNATGELKQLHPALLQPSDYLPWKEKYGKFYRRLDDGYFFYPEAQKFKHFMYRFEELEGYLAVNERAMQALQDWQKVDAENEVSLLSWLVNYEEEGLALLHFDFYVDESEDKSRRWMANEGLNIDYTPFEILDQFKDVFDGYYWVRWEKYDPRSLKEWNNNFFDPDHKSPTLKESLFKKGIVLTPTLWQ